VGCLSLSNTRFQPFFFNLLFRYFSVQMINCQSKQDLNLLVQWFAGYHFLLIAYAKWNHPEIIGRFVAAFDIRRKNQISLPRPQLMIGLKAGMPHVIRAFQN